MLGERGDQLAAKPIEHTPASPAISTRGLGISGLVGPKQLRIPEWKVPPGQIVGVAGLAGAGVEELFAILFGRLKAKAGIIELPSGAAAPASSWDAVKAGVAYFPADRKRIGLMLAKSVAENVCSVRSLVQKRDGFLLRRSEQEAISRRRCETLGVKAASMQQSVAALSGGNQQKVVFGKWLEADPSLVLLDDPTRGVDIGAKREMHRIIRKLADEGRVVLIYSSEPIELVNLADRVHVFVDGGLSAELAGDALTEHNLVSAMNVTVRAA
jgi:ribose transport system ATP-binding protein